MKPVRDWFVRHFSDPQVVLLTLLLATFAIAVVLLADMLAPLLVGLVIAYLLQGLVSRLERYGMSHLGAVVIVFLAFMLLLLLTVFGLLPPLAQQLTQLLQQLPSMIGQVQEILMQLPEDYPNFVTEEQVLQFMASLRREVLDLAQQLLTSSVSSLVAVITAVVYLILVPFLVFFMIKDKDRIIAWVTSFLPPDRRLTSEVWSEVDRQIGNYIRGKFWEIILVGSVTYVVFALLGLDYALLLAALTGFSVLLPYVGVAVVTIPIAVVAYLQWGFGDEMLWVLLAYGVIQLIDGNILAPLLLSEAVNLHPVAIIAAILLFGGLWGFWGIFFAIPLATLCQAVLRAWPRRPQVPSE